MNRKFAKLDESNKIIYAPDTVTVNGVRHWHPFAEHYSAADDGPWFPIDSTKPEKLGVYFISTEYGDESVLPDGRKVIVRRYDERPIVAPLPPVTRYSGWKMYKAIKAEGYGEAFDALMKADIGVMIAFVRPQYFLSDDADFTAMVTQMCAALHIDDETKERILAASVDEEVR